MNYTPINYKYYINNSTIINTDDTLLVINAYDVLS